ncbi:hypothetical protein [Microbacterium azadirachtae]|uniref:Uncharacterized protein n=1 Tax=Microbacterium azadirachtae TaxID=582680 RepID=A0A0F0LS24_9MICO|nr:hypothetical protein [Microbacterium azadirachtae]KJL34296.1 hypothetical protein RS86_01083 [Microbacterium azadirachtae]
MFRSSMNPSDARNEQGVALVLVVFVMLIGLIAASAIAAAIFFVINGNATNKSNTQAFIAAESGRDAALANVLKNCSLVTRNLIGGGGTAPFYDASVDKCPNTPDPGGPPYKSTFTITSTGFDLSGAKTKVTSQYIRNFTSGIVGGQVAYFDGSFTLTHSQYSGDLVIRSGNYNCTTSKSTIDGDLWVLGGSDGTNGGNVTLSQGCTVTGSIYAAGSVTFGQTSDTVGGSVIAAHDVTISTNGFTIGAADPAVKGGIHAGGAINFTNAKSGTIAGDVLAGGTYTASAGVTIGGSAKGGVAPSPAVFSPTLQDVYAQSAWVDLSTARAPWGSGVDWRTPSSCTADVTALLQTPPAAGKTQIGLDYSACSSAVVVAINGPGKKPGNYVLNYDTVVLVPAAASMDVVLGGSPGPAAGTKTQLFFIHGDPTVNAQPDCSTNVGWAGDGISVPSTMGSGLNLMFYSACGVGKIAGNANPFTGQFYAGGAGQTGWVQPVFTCQPMKWETAEATSFIDIGCEVGKAGGSGTPSPPQPQIPFLTSQAEQ